MRVVAMHQGTFRGRVRAALAVAVLAGLALAGCKALSDRLSRWQVLGGEALEDPIQAVGGDGVVFAPHGDGRPLTRGQLAAAGPQELVAYCAPVFIQQRIDTKAQRHPYPPEYDEIGEARMCRDDKGRLAAESATRGAPGEPAVSPVIRLIASW